MATSGTDLLARMAAGDREAFAVFYDRYAPVVFRLILRIVRERADGRAPAGSTRRAGAPRPGW